MSDYLLSLHISNIVPLVAGLYILYILVQWRIDPLRDIPGPFAARFTRFWYFYKIYQGDFEITNIKIHEIYGPVVRIAPNEYSVNDLAAAKVIYGHGNSFVKASWYWAFMPPDPAKASLFADQDPHHHGKQRRKFASAYSMTSLVGYETFVDHCTSLLVSRFHEIARSNQTTSFGHWFQCYAFDVIGEITFGQRFGFLDKGIDKDNVFGAIESRTSYSTFVGLFPALHRFLFPLLPSNGGHAYVAKYTKAQISSREVVFKDPEKKGRDGPLDFVSRFLTVHAENPRKMTSMDIFTICQSNIGAGSDTTAITLSAVLYNLLKHPETYKTLQVEIDAGIAAGKISKPITFKEASGLPYLQAVIKEALRLHSATGLPMARVIPSSGATIGGYSLPGGATVGINPWVAHRNASVYGVDAEAWRPERWLEIQEQGRGGDMEKYFFAFGMGSRTCIGRNLSLLEVSKLIPELIRNFEFVLEGNVHHYGWKTTSRWFVKPQNFFGQVVERTV